MPDDVVIQLITTGGLIVVAIVGNKKLNRIGGDAKEARDQTANTHDTNLRDDLDEKFAGLARKVDHLGREITSLHDDDAVIDSTLSRQRIRASKALADAVRERDEMLDRLREEVPSIARREIAQHVRDCPLRNPPQ